MDQRTSDEDSTPRPPAGQAQAARAAAGEAARAAEAAGQAPRGRPSDVFGGEVRRRDIFTLLVFHLIARAESGASYGNQLIEQIEAITAGAVSLNPNTMYPLLRGLEGAGFIEGRWEHPEKRSRRLYTLTAEGRAECDRLKQCLEPFLDSIIDSISLIKREIYG
jgi:PadR family transcriptional regulator, regulatory protein PadR